MAWVRTWILTAFFTQAADSLHQNGLLTEDQYQMALCVKSIAVQNFPPGRMVISLPDRISSPPIHKLASMNFETENLATSDFMFKIINEEMLWNLKVFIPSHDHQNVQFKYILQFRDNIPQYHIILAWSDDERDITKVIKNQVMAMTKSSYINQRGKFLLVMPVHISVPLKEFLLQIFENLLNKWNIFDVLVVIPTQNVDDKQDKETRNAIHSTFDIYTWFPFQSAVPSIENIVLLDQWLGENEGRFIGNSHLFPNKIPTKFRGRKLRVSAIAHEPLAWLIGNYTDVDGEINYNITGPEFDMFQIVCDQLGLHIAYLSPNTHEGSGNWDLCYKLMNVTSDVGFGFLALSTLGYCDVEYTTPILNSQMKLFVTCPSQRSRIEKLGEIFDVASWTAMLVVFLLLNLVIFVLAKTRRKVVSRESPAYKSISSCLYNMWAVHLGVSVTDMPRTTILRALFIMCVWYAYAMGNLFQMYFTSFLVDPGLEKAVTNTEEYLDANIKLSLQDMLAPYFLELISDIPNLKFDGCYPFPECIKGLFTSKNYSTLTYNLWVHYYTKVKYPRRKTEICFLTDRQYTDQYTFLLPIGSPYRDSLNGIIRRVLEAGIMEHFVKMSIEAFRYIRIPDADLSEEVSDYFVFTLSHMKFAFSAILYGHSFSTALFVCEILYYKISANVSKKTH